MNDYVTPFPYMNITNFTMGTSLWVYLHISGGHTVYTKAIFFCFKMYTFQMCLMAQSALKNVGL